MTHPQASNDPRPTFEQFAAVRRYQPALTFSPDGSEVAYVVNTSGQFNLWRQRSAGGFPHQLTLFSDQAVREAAWSPDGERIVITADRDGDEFKQLYVIPAKGGQPEPLTDAPQVRHALASQPWSPDDRSLAYAGNDREPTDQDVLIRDMGGAEVGRLMAGGGLYYPATWSPDGSMLTVIEAKSNTDFSIHLLTLGKDDHTLLTPHDEETIYEAGP